MPKGKSLKSQNTPLLVLFAVWCLAVYTALLSGPQGFWGNLKSAFTELSAEDGVVMILSPLLALVLTGIVSSGNKARLVFWRHRHALPGHRCFSQLAKEDPRIDLEALVRKLGDVPQAPASQNRTWFKLFKEYESSTTVEHAHRQFLLARDMCAMAFVFATLGPWAIGIVVGSMSWAFAYFAVMIVQYLVLAVVARNQGNRLVCNVLAEFVADSRS